MLINFFHSVHSYERVPHFILPDENAFIDYSKLFQKAGMRASNQGSKILNEFSIKTAQCLDYFCTNCCFETLSFSKKGVTTRGGVEDTRLEAKANDTKKIRGQGQGQPFRGQNLLRPRTGMLETKAKDQGHRRKRSSKKKKVFKFFFQTISNLLAYPDFLIGGGLNHKSHEMTSSKFFQRESTCGTKLS